MKAEGTLQARMWVSIRIFLKAPWAVMRRVYVSGDKIGRKTYTVSLMFGWFSVSRHRLIINTPPSSRYIERIERESGYAPWPAHVFSTRRHTVNRTSVPSRMSRRARFDFNTGHHGAKYHHLWCELLLEVDPLSVQSAQKWTMDPSCPPGCTETWVGCWSRSIQPSK